MKRIRNKILIFGVAQMTALLGISEASAVQAQSMKVVTGTISGNLSSIASKDNKSLKIYTNRTGHLEINFNLGGLEANRAYRLEARLNQKRASDKYTFQYLDSSGTARDLFVNTGKGYKDISVDIPLAATKNRSVQLRLITSKGADDAELDVLAVNALSSSPTLPTPDPEPTPAPNPNPNPTPTPEPMPIPVTSLPVGTTWYWQLQGTIKTNINAKVYDIDLFDNSASSFNSLKKDGRIVICYFSAGTYENWRSDAKDFPTAALGANMDDWPGERWLDVRNAGVRQVMAARLDLAKAKGCDGVEPDNVDGYSNKNGVGLTKQDQINYNSYIADQARARGLLIALKNSTDLVSALVDKFDFAVVEECFAYNECEAYKPFVARNKAVLNAEYTKYSANTCSRAKAMGLSTVFFNLDLNGKVYNPCP